MMNPEFDELQRKDQRGDGDASVNHPQPVFYRLHQSMIA